MLHKGGKNVITNKRLYLLRWWVDISGPRRRGWRSYIELQSTCHFGLREAIFRLAPLITLDRNLAPDLKSFLRKNPHRKYVTEKNSTLRDKELNH